MNPAAFRESPLWQYPEAVTIPAKSTILDVAALLDPTYGFRFIKCLRNNLFMHLVQYCVIYHVNNLTVDVD